MACSGESSVCCRVYSGWVLTSVHFWILRPVSCFFLFSFFMTKFHYENQLPCCGWNKHGSECRVRKYCCEEDSSRCDLGTVAMKWQEIYHTLNPFHDFIWSESRCCYVENAILIANYVRFRCLQSAQRNSKFHGFRQSGWDVGVCSQNGNDTTP